MVTSGTMAATGTLVEDEEGVVGSDNSSLIGNTVPFRRLRFLLVSAGAAATALERAEIVSGEIPSSAIGTTAAAELEDDDEVEAAQDAPGTEEDEPEIEIIWPGGVHSGGPISGPPLVPYPDQYRHFNACFKCPL